MEIARVGVSVSRPGHGSAKGIENGYRAIDFASAADGDASVGADVRDALVSRRSRRTCRALRPSAERSGLQHRLGRARRCRGHPVITGRDDDGRTPRPVEPRGPDSPTVSGPPASRSADRRHPERPAGYGPRERADRVNAGNEIGRHPRHWQAWRSPVRTIVWASADRKPARHHPGEPAASGRASTTGSDHSRIGRPVDR